MTENSEDILRVLAIMFRGQRLVPRENLERTLSLDMQWMNTEDAAKVVDAFLNKSWLIEEDGGLVAGAETIGVTTPLGWFPRNDRLLDPIQNDYSSVPSREKIVIEPIPIPVVEGKKTHSTLDPRTSIENRLMRFIAKSSGIEKQEIQRRAKRKVLALGAMTMWMALGLIAKEQGLDTIEIVNQLSL